MRLLLLLMAILCGARAHAALEILPGSSPQTAAVRFHYEPIRVRVTNAAGAPVHGASVGFSLSNWGFGHGSGLGVAGGAGRCVIDLGVHCWSTTDERGEATLPTLFPHMPGTHELQLRSDFGEAVAVLHAYTPDRIPQLEVIEGSGERAPPAASFWFTVRAVDAGGQPIAGMEVTFEHKEGARIVPNIGFFERYTNKAVTDANGIARSPAFAGSDEGTGVLIASSGRFPRTEIHGEARFTYTIARDAPVRPIDYQDLWWGGLQENGWGVSIAQDGTEIFPVIFTYDAAGQPTWYVAVNPRPEGNAGWTYYRYLASMFSPRSSPYHAYDASRFQLGAAVGYADFTFHAPDRILLGVSLAPPSYANNATKRLVRQDFTGDIPAPMTISSGMWWGGPSQNGWGLSIMQQPGGVFIVWMTYGDDGRPTWFVMPSGTWTGSRTYEGRILRASGASFLAYDPSRFRLEDVGAFRVRFDDATSATFEWSVGPHRGTERIVKQPL